MPPAVDALFPAFRSRPGDQLIELGLTRRRMTQATPSRVAGEGAGDPVPVAGARAGRCRSGSRRVRWPPGDRPGFPHPGIVREQLIESGDDTDIGLGRGRRGTSVEGIAPVQSCRCRYTAAFGEQGPPAATLIGP